MIHFPISEQNAEADTIQDPPQVCAKDPSAEQLRVVMRALDDAIAESQRLRARIAPHLSTPSDHD